MSEFVLPITGLPMGQISPSVIVCGDPGRASRIAERLDDARVLSDRREYRAYQGRYQGMAVTVCSHGVGAPGAAIAFEELIVGGARQIIRVGTCGGLQPDMVAGDLVVAAAAVQNTGYGREVVPEGYPAVADSELTQLLSREAQQNGRRFSWGIVLSRDCFYAGLPTVNAPDYQLLSQANVLAVEMECAALFLVGSLRRAQTAAILVVDGNVLQQTESVESYLPDREVVQMAVGTAIDVALRALAAKTR
jgi:uridine phosphorylase